MPVRKVSSTALFSTQKRVAMAEDLCEHAKK